MFFLFRCVFWLSIVFYSMPWPQLPSGDGKPESGVLQMAAGVASDLASAAATAAKDKLEEGCAKDPAGCLGTAARLSQFVATGESLAVSPPKRPLRLADNETGRPTPRKLPPQRN